MAQQTTTGTLDERIDHQLRDLDDARKRKDTEARRKILKRLSELRVAQRTTKARKQRPVTGRPELLPPSRPVEGEAISSRPELLPPPLPARVLVPGGARQPSSSPASSPAPAGPPEPAVVDRTLLRQPLNTQDFAGFPRESLLGPTGSSGGLSFSSASAAPAVARTGGAASQPPGSGTSGSADAIGGHLIDTAQLRKALGGGTPKTLLMRLVEGQGGVTLAQLRVLAPLHVQQLGQRFGTFDRLLDLARFQQRSERDAAQDARLATTAESMGATRAQALAVSQRKEQEAVELGRVPGFIRQGNLTPQDIQNSRANPTVGPVDPSDPKASALAGLEALGVGPLFDNPVVREQAVAGARGVEFSPGIVSQRIGQVQAMQAELDRLGPNASPDLIQKLEDRIKATLQSLRRGPLIGVMSSEDVARLREFQGSTE